MPKWVERARESYGWAAEKEEKGSQLGERTSPFQA